MSNEVCKKCNGTGTSFKGTNRLLEPLTKKIYAPVVSGCPRCKGTGKEL